MRSTLKLMADYHCSPIWWTEGRVGNVEIETLPISHQLKAALSAWAASYDRTLDLSDPQEGGFRSATEADAFDSEGQRLWRALQQELGAGYKVVYFSDRRGRLYE
jgi:hypothetical protein